MRAIDLCAESFFAGHGARAPNLQTGVLKREGKKYLHSSPLSGSHRPEVEQRSLKLLLIPSLLAPRASIRLPRHLLHLKTLGSRDQLIYASELVFFVNLF